MNSLPVAFNIGMALGVGLFATCAHHGCIDELMYKLESWLRRLRN